MSRSMISTPARNPRRARRGCAVAVVAMLWAGTLGAADWSVRALSEIAVHPEYRVPAVVSAREVAHVSAEVAGRIEALPARVGAVLARGDRVARLDPRPFEIELKRAEAQAALVASRIRLAEVQLAQSESLARERFVSSEALKVRRTELEVLRSEQAAAAEVVAAARLALERTVIRAPFAGVVSERKASVGELAAPGSPLIVLVANGDAEVHAQVPVTQVAALERDAGPVLAAGEARYRVEVRRISPLVEPAGQTREVVLGTRDPLPPGLAGELRWRSPDPQLPPEYVQMRDGRLGAFVVEAGAPVFRPLPGAQAGRPVRVDWPPDTPVVDRGRLAIGLGDAGQ